jgi:hypothetical protein
MILDKRFIKTGPDLRPEDLTAAAWPLGEIAVLARNQSGGIVALDDVRGGNIKSLASAVGEGSIAIAFVHQVLRQVRTQCADRPLVDPRAKAATGSLARRAHRTRGPVHGAAAR